MSPTFKRNCNIKSSCNLMTARESSLKDSQHINLACLRPTVVGFNVGEKIRPNLTL